MSLPTVIFITALVGFFLQVLKGTERYSQTMQLKKLTEASSDLSYKSSKARENMAHTFNSSVLSNVNQQQGAVNIYFKLSVTFLVSKC